MSNQKEALRGRLVVQADDVTEDVCPAGTQVVDWFHAVQHLSDAAHAFQLE